MPLVLSSSSVFHYSHVNQLKLHDLRFHINAQSNPTCTSTHFFNTQKLCLANKTITLNLKNKSPRDLKFVSVRCMNSSNEFFDEESGVDNDWSDQEDEGIDDMGSPWEGAVVYQRNASISHVEYCTTLERLGLGKLSTEVSKSRASLMGLRVTKSVKDFPLGTPVLISVDITRKKQKLRLDGIIRTVLTLGCNRYFIYLIARVSDSTNLFFSVSC